MSLARDLRYVHGLAVAGLIAIVYFLCALSIGYQYPDDASIWTPVAAFIGALVSVLSRSGGARLTAIAGAAIITALAAFGLGMPTFRPIDFLAAIPLLLYTVIEVAWSCTHRETRPDPYRTNELVANLVVLAILATALLVVIDLALLPTLVYFLVVTAAVVASLWLTAKFRSTDQSRVRQWGVSPPERKAEPGSVALMLLVIVLAAPVGLKAGENLSTKCNGDRADRVATCRALIRWDKQLASRD